MSSLANNLERERPIQDLRMCWWSFAVRGSLAIVFAVILFLASSFLGIFFFDPVTLVYMSLLLGSFVLGNGLLLAVAAFFSFEHHMHVWWLLLCESCFALLLGVYIGVSLLLTPQTFAFLAGLDVLGAGLLPISSGRQDAARRFQADPSRHCRHHLCRAWDWLPDPLQSGPRVTTQVLAGFELFCGIVWMVFAYRLQKRRRLPPIPKRWDS